MKIFAFLGFAVLLNVSTAAAAVIWSDDFSNPNRANLTNTGPNFYSFPGGATAHDYVPTMASGDTAVVGSGVLTITDTNNGTGNFIAVFANQFSQSSFAPGTPITVSYDLRVDSYLASAITSGQSGAPRFSIFDGSGANGSEIFTIGWGTANYSGASANTLGFYRGLGAGAGITVGNGVGIGAPDFDFGTYTHGAGNGGLNGTNGDFYRVTLDLAQGSNLVSGSISLLDGSGNPAGTPATFTNITMGGTLNWSGDAALEGFRITTGAGGTGVFVFDNITISAIPEPSTIGLVSAAGLAGLALLRRRTSAG